MVFFGWIHSASNALTGEGLSDGVEWLEGNYNTTAIFKPLVCAIGGIITPLPPPPSPPVEL